MNPDYYIKKTDYGPEPYVVNIEQKAMQNMNFRTALWTGCHLQVTLMCIPVHEDIGLEMHEDTDQMLRVEQGEALVIYGNCKHHLDSRQELCQGDVIFVPAGTWHNVINIGRRPLKLSSVYASPNHPRGAVHRTKADADKAEH